MTESKESTRKLRDGKKPLISIVVVTKNCEETIAKALASIFRSEYPKKEVLVVDGESDDDTLEVARRFPVQIYSDKGKGLGYARDLGRRKARGEFVAYCDGEKVIEKNWFGKLMRYFKNPKVGGVTDIQQIQGSDFIAKARNAYLWILHYSNSLLSKIGRIRTVKGGNTIWRKKALDSVQGFDEEFQRACEDMDLSYRVSDAGWKLLVGDAMSWSLENPSLQELSEAFRAQGQKLNRYAKKNKASLSPFRTIYILLVGALLTPFIIHRTRSLKSLGWPIYLLKKKLIHLTRVVQKGEEN